MLLGQIARLPLHLVTAHPDMAGGLGFLGLVQAKFALVILPLSILISANAGIKIIHEDIPLTILQPTLMAYVGMVIGLFIAPLLVFTPMLIAAKRRGLLQYGGLAVHYIGLFEDKWIRNQTQEGLLGTGDIQSLADLGNSFDYVRKMKPVPFDAQTIMILAGAAILPLLPLALTVIPLQEILRTLWKLLL
jgi:hypothetical protein